jgi:predicted alpha/beta hydrolase
MPEFPHRIPALDGYPLAARLLVPDGEPKAVVQLNGGTAIVKEFYGSFARFLVENGYAVCLWDYRGTGESAPPSLRDFPARMLDWGTLDMPAVLDFLDDRFPTLPKLVFGHSAGGQQVGFMPNLDKLSGLVCFATSSGYWGFMPPDYRLKTRLFFQGVVPVGHALVGYTAARRLGIMEDLPKGVALEWRNWCSRPDYFFDEQYFGKTVPTGRFEALPFSVKVFWATDDPISNARSVPAFWRHVRSLHSLDVEALRPAEVGLNTIGHFGFFRKTARETLWPKALAELETMRLARPFLNEPRS